MSVPGLAEVFRCLADGGPHCDDTLAAASGMTPAAIRAALDELEIQGLEIERLPDNRCRLAGTIEPLDAAAVAAGLAPEVAAAADVEVLAEARSSNDILLAKPPPGAGGLRVCLVEYQHGGRGRRGRRWQAPPGGALCMSVGWHFPSSPPGLSALSLAVGVAARRAIGTAAGIEAGVKWPNDLVVAARKLGGVLVELRHDGGGTQAVAGIGINVRMAARRLAAVSDWPHGAIDLATAAGGRSIGRNDLAAALINELHAMLTVFADRGFAPFVDEWSQAHVLRNEPAVLSADSTAEHGTVRGVDPDGALLFETGGKLRRVLAGEVSVRPET